MPYRPRAAFYGVVCAAITACQVPVAVGATPLTTVRIATGLERPIYLTSSPGDASRLYVLEKHGRIRLIKNGVVLSDPFLDIKALIDGGDFTGSEQGLLGLAFDPGYETNGYFYVNYTDKNGSTVIARYGRSTDPDVADAMSAFILLTIAQPYANHNGGWLAFGPRDGYLYIATGDGGDMCDPGARAQQITDQLLGKILRIDVRSDAFPADAGRNYGIPPGNPFVGKTGDDEIWSFGLRNPWRPSFDRLTADLYIADVGQRQREEIDYQPATSGGGENYGWDCKEGSACSTISNCFVSGCVCDDASLIDPVLEYDHTAGCSITGGYVYRGCAIPDLRGTYFYGDYCSGNISSFRMIDGKVANKKDRTAELDPPGTLRIWSVASFGEDSAGELYIVQQDGGDIYKIVPEGDPPMLGDVDGDGMVNLRDFPKYPSCEGGPGNVSAGDGCGVFDFDCNGTVDLRDFASVQNIFIVSP